jgi:ubiquinone/menaquinone biosynthesis C-methylase UbiE
MTAIDLGCGMGFFSRGMAKIVGDAGKVIAVDLQQEMLDITRKRAEKDGVAHRIRFHRAEEDNLNISEQVDFALAFWMAHEVNDEARFFEQVFSALKPAGAFLIAEPRMHVTQSRFEELLKFAENAGFKINTAPQIRISRAAVLKK